MRTDAALDAASARRLAAMAPQLIDAARPAAIKRNVHELEVDCDAARFAAALRAVMIDPDAAFGVIRLRRPADRVGRDFVVGERFCGCIGLGRLAAARGAPRWLAALLNRPWLENRVACDHAEITELALEPDAAGRRRVAYRYLAGTPLAGTSAYTITPRGAAACHLEVAFTYQETTTAALTLLHRLGLRIHDDAVLAQATAAAARAGARVVRHTLPTSS